MSPPPQRCIHGSRPARSLPVLSYLRDSGGVRCLSERGEDCPCAVLDAQGQGDANAPRGSRRAAQRPDLRSWGVGRRCPMIEGAALRKLAVMVSGAGRCPEENRINCGTGPDSARPAPSVRSPSRAMRSATKFSSRTTAACRAEIGITCTGCFSVWELERTKPSACRSPPVWTGIVEAGIDRAHEVGHSLPQCRGQAPRGRPAAGPVHQPHHPSGPEAALETLHLPDAQAQRRRDLPIRELPRDQRLEESRPHHFLPRHLSASHVSMGATLSRGS